MTSVGYRVAPGSWQRSGVLREPDGVNFCVYSRHASRVELLLFESADDTAACQTIRLDAEQHRTYFHWHVLVHDLPDGVWYCWRADGRRDTTLSGCRYDPDKALLDPRAVTVDDRLWDRARACEAGNNVASGMRAMVTGNHYDWEGDTTLQVPLHEAVIYEMHVGGFTRHPSAGVAQPGTFAAVVEKIPYLQALGVTHVELLPVMAFDRQDVPAATAELGHENYWGYSTHSFYAVHPGYAVDSARARDEFRDMVKALHAAGIGIILDVVFNHTAEGSPAGPVINFKGLCNEEFYHLDEHDRSRYRDYSGCGNTVNANHPLVTGFLVTCLRYWVAEMHVDGFRFDLASALARGEDGRYQRHAPFLWATELSPLLSGAHIIAEAWDAAGLYQVGDFPGFRWAEWNGRYRDVLRSFVKGDRGLIGEIATRIAGSSDMYEVNGRLPANSINFITCHDGFTLNDLVSYDRKHNHCNGEANRDGHNDNRSWNCGVEGATDDERVIDLRHRQARNFLALLLLSQGVPMLLYGDELLRSQGGNNNGYCLDDEAGWLDWRLAERNAKHLAFTRAMVALRRRHPSLGQRRFLSGATREGWRLPDVTWHGVQLDRPAWNDADARELAFTLGGEPGVSHLHVMINMGEADKTFDVPLRHDVNWSVVVDTARKPWVFETPERGRRIEQPYRVVAHGVVVLEGMTLDPAAA